MKKTGITINSYLEKKNPKLREVAEGIRKLMKRAVPRISEAINPWGVPTFEFNGPLCYMMIGKHHVTLGFLRGTSLMDPKRLLEGTGRNLRHVKLRTVEDVKMAGLKELLAEAAHLNRVQPPSDTMRRMKSK